MMADAVFSLVNICRSFPRSTSDIPAAILREMLLPSSRLDRARTDYFYALKDVNISLQRKQRVGIIGTHLSGKTTLANIASGLLDPTSGKVISNGTRLLISRPTAGFKPALTISENLGFRASLMGLYGQKLEETLDETFFLCGIASAKANQPIGNLSPFIVKQLAFTLLLTFDAEIVIVDELTSAGPPDFRKKTRLQLEEKLENCSSLIITSYPSSLMELTKFCFILESGKLSGPLKTEVAIEKYEELGTGNLESESNSDDLEFETNTNLGNTSGISITSGYEKVGNALIDKEKGQKIISDKLSDLQSHISKHVNNPERKSARSRLSNSSRKSAVFSVSTLKVDGDENYSHQSYCLLRSRGEMVSVEIDLVANRDFFIGGEVIELFEGGVGSIRAKTKIDRLPNRIVAGKSYKLEFQFQVPEDKDGYFGLGFTPMDDSHRLLVKSRIKILIMGVGVARAKRIEEIQIIASEFKES